MILAVVFVAASLFQAPGSNQNAHLALVKALSHGTAVIDRYRGETADVAEYEGHYYSAKAPGLALLTVAPYAILDRTGALDRVARITGKPRDYIDLWAIAVLICPLALGLIMVLVMRLGGDVAQEYGSIAAVTIAAGTLLLPFSTMAFTHVPAAALAFAAFALLWLRRSMAASLAAGTLAGLAITVEYPLALAALALGMYAITAGDRLRRGLAYAMGVVVGVAPLLVYNWLVFGSPLHFPYEDALPIDERASNEQGLFGISWPSPATAARLLFGERGLVVITPVVLCAVAALVPLYRRGFRREAMLIGGLALAFLVYNAGYNVPFGGVSPGPRFLIAVLPFLAVPLALSYALWPLVTSALAVPSVVYAIGITVTGPLEVTGWNWVDDVGVTPGQATRLLALVVAFALAIHAIPMRNRASGGAPEAP